MDAHTWAKREERYAKKFAAGRKYIPELFEGLSLPPDMEQIALLGFASNANVKTLAGGRVMTSADLLAEITEGIGNMKKRGQIYFSDWCPGDESVPGLRIECIRGGRSRSGAKK